VQVHQGILRRRPHPGDVIFHNDVFSLGNQNNDVAVYKPIFHSGKLVAWTAVKGHQADIGGNVRGGYNPNAVEVWQEALRIPPVKVVEKGKLRKDVWNLIFANIRLDIVQHDMKAEMGACTVGERRLLELLDKYGLESYEAHKQALFEATRKMMEAEIAKIPNGNYSGEGYIYYDGRHEGSKFTIRVDIEVKDRSIKFDYSRTDAQTNGFVNGTFTSSASATILTLLQMVNPDIPHNEGMVQPIEIVIPEGTVLNAAYPKATTFGNHLCPPNADAIQRALAPVMPDRVTAGWNNLLCSLTTGTDPEKNEQYVDIGFMGLKGGSGAMLGMDGYDHIGMIDASGGVLDQDYEMFEQQTPHRLVKHELLTDSAGAGEWRGGLGVETIFEIGSEDTQLVTFGDGDFEPAFGLFGGKDAGLNFIRLHYPDGTHGGAEEQGPHHRRAERHGVPPGRQRRRRLRRTEEARPQGIGRGDPQRRDLEGSGDARLRHDGTGVEVRFSLESRWVRDRAAGVFCCAHVPRQQPAAAASSFTSLRRTPHRPDPDTLAQFYGSKAQTYPARGVGCPIPGSKGGGLGEARPGGHGGNRTPGNPGTRHPQGN
jgi:N-methylhydantoinase B